MAALAELIIPDSSFLSVLLSASACFDPVYCFQNFDNKIFFRFNHMIILARQSHLSDPHGATVPDFESQA